MSRNSKYILAILALALSACSNNDGDEPSSPTSPVIMINLGNAGIDIWQDVSTSRTRDLSLEQIESAGVFAVNESKTVFYNQQFFYRSSTTLPSSISALIQEWPDGNDWLYTPQQRWSAGANYTFVGYTPYSDKVSFQSENGKITELTWPGLSSISASDYLLSTCNGYKALGKDNPALPLELKHLMARLRFCFKLGDNYADLRSIVVKEMKVNYSESRSMTLNVSFAEDGYGGYKSTYRWDRGEPGSSETSVTLRNEPGVGCITLAKDVDYQALASLYYEPGDPLSMFNIEVIYDVYDSHNLLLRANDHAVSSITMMRTVEAGNYYDVKIKIEPSYLYILSDKEPDTDGELIIP